MPTQCFELIVGAERQFQLEYPAAMFLQRLSSNL